MYILIDYYKNPWNLLIFPSAQQSKTKSSHSLRSQTAAATFATSQDVCDTEKGAFVEQERQFIPWKFIGWNYWFWICKFGICAFCFSKYLKIIQGLEFHRAEILRLVLDVHPKITSRDSTRANFLVHFSEDTQIFYGSEIRYLNLAQTHLSNDGIHLVFSWRSSFSMHQRWLPFPKVWLSTFRTITFPLFKVSRGESEKRLGSRVLVNGLVDACDVPPRGSTWKKLHGRKTPLSFRSLEDIFIPSQKIGNKIGWQNLATSRRHTEKFVTIVLLFFVTEMAHRMAPGIAKRVFRIRMGVLTSGNGMFFSKRIFSQVEPFWEFQRVATVRKTWFESTFFYGHPVNTGCFWGDWEAGSFLIWVPFCLNRISLEESLWRWRDTWRKQRILSCQSDNC